MANGAISFKPPFWSSISFESATVKLGVLLPAIQIRFLLDCMPGTLKLYSYRITRVTRKSSLSCDSGITDLKNTFLRSVIRMWMKSLMRRKSLKMNEKFANVFLTSPLVPIKSTSNPVTSPSSVPVTSTSNPVESPSDPVTCPSVLVTFTSNQILSLHQILSRIRQFLRRVLKRLRLVVKCLRQPLQKVPVGSPHFFVAFHYENPWYASVNSWDSCI